MDLADKYDLAVRLIVCENCEPDLLFPDELDSETHMRRIVFNSQFELIELICSNDDLDGN